MALAPRLCWQQKNAQRQSCLTFFSNLTSSTYLIHEAAADASRGQILFIKNGKFEHLLPGADWSPGPGKECSRLVRSIRTWQR